MAQINITLDESELLELFAGNRDQAFKNLCRKGIEPNTFAESTAQLNAMPYERVESEDGLPKWNTRSQVSDSDRNVGT